MAVPLSAFGTLNLRCLTHGRVHTQPRPSCSHQHKSDRYLSPAFDSSAHPAVQYAQASVWQVWNELQRATISVLQQLQSHYRLCTSHRCSRPPLRGDPCHPRRQYAGLWANTSRCRHLRCVRQRGPAAVYWADPQGEGSTASLSCCCLTQGWAEAGVDPLSLASHG